MGVLKQEVRNSDFDKIIIKILLIRLCQQDFFHYYLQDFAISCRFSGFYTFKWCHSVNECRLFLNSHIIALYYSR